MLLTTQRGTGPGHPLEAGRSTPTERLITSVDCESSVLHCPSHRCPGIRTLPSEGFTSFFPSLPQLCSNTSTPPTVAYEGPSSISGRNWGRLPVTQGRAEVWKPRSLGHCGTRPPSRSVPLFYRPPPFAVPSLSLFHSSLSILSKPMSLEYRMHNPQRLQAVSSTLKPSSAPVVIPSSVLFPGSVEARPTPLFSIFSHPPSCTTTVQHPIDSAASNQEYFIVANNAPRFYALPQIRKAAARASPPSSAYQRECLSVYLFPLSHLVDPTVPTFSRPRFGLRSISSFIQPRFLANAALFSSLLLFLAYCFELASPGASRISAYCSFTTLRQEAAPAGAFRPFSNLGSPTQPGPTRLVHRPRSPPPTKMASCLLCPPLPPSQKEFKERMAVPCLRIAHLLGYSVRRTPRWKGEGETSEILKPGLGELTPLRESRGEAKIVNWRLSNKRRLHGYLVRWAASRLSRSKIRAVTRRAVPIILRYPPTQFIIEVLFHGALLEFTLVHYALHIAFLELSYGIPSVLFLLVLQSQSLTVSSLMIQVLDFLHFDSFLMLEIAPACLPPLSFSNIDTKRLLIPQPPAYSRLFLLWTSYGHTPSRSPLAVTPVSHLPSLSGLHQCHRSTLYHYSRYGFARASSARNKTTIQSCGHRIRPPARSRTRTALSTLGRPRHPEASPTTGTTNVIANDARIQVPGSHGAEARAVEERS
ncbi:hypothetical protein NMY22_g18165 [Coprinellus aureogranulatus]|nr:hypothetical protein NMY22_g18165 [Coprinellus aureogranulatus]